MPHEDETRPCPHEGCSGIQTFNREARPPAWGVGTRDDDGNILWQNQTKPAWACSTGHEALRSGRFKLTHHRRRADSVTMPFGVVAVRRARDASRVLGPSRTACPRAVQALAAADTWGRPAASAW